MSFVLGLDSGGSKTLAAIADETGTILRRWEGPGLDPQRVPDWRRRLAEAVHALCGGEAPSAAVLGLPMHGEIAALTEEQNAVAKGLFPGPALVLNDVEIAYDGAFPDLEGVLLLAGTGSMAWAKAAGESLRVGGWGDAFGDEGSAFWIGREALSIVGQALDGRRSAPDFVDGVLAAADTTADDLVGWAFGRANFRAAAAALARAVDSLADAGDGTAESLLRSAADRLAEHVLAARRKLDRPGLGWSHAGGVFGSRTIVRQLSKSLGAPVKPKTPPFGGALWRAAKLAGWPAEARFVEALSAYR